MSVSTGTFCIYTIDKEPHLAYHITDINESINLCKIKCPYANVEKWASLDNITFISHFRYTVYESLYEMSYKKKKTESFFKPDNELSFLTRKNPKIIQERELDKETDDIAQRFTHAQDITNEKHFILDHVVVCSVL